jgi:hypothetical protein
MYGTKSIEKLMSLFGGSLGVYSKASSKYLNIGWSSRLVVLSLVSSSIWDEKI